MTDPDYWRQRCEAAEDALRRARSRIWISPARVELLEILADLRPGETMTIAEIARRCGKHEFTIEKALSKLHGAGLVDRGAGRGCGHRPTQWKLGYMVVIEALADVREAT